MPESEEPKGFFQYFPSSPHHSIQGLYITDFGWTEIEPNVQHPPWQHPSEFSFMDANGRCLDEFQLVYITGGQGSFGSSRTAEQEIGATPIWEQGNAANSQIHNCYLSIGKRFVQGVENLPALRIFRERNAPARLPRAYTNPGDPDERPLLWLSSGSVPICWCR